MITEINNNVRLSPHFKLSEFLNLRKYPENIPTMQVVANLTYGCHLLLEPARLIVGPNTRGQDLVHLRRKWKTEVNRLPFFRLVFEIIA